MRARLLSVALAAFGVFLLGWAALLYPWRSPGGNVAVCADCLGYVRDVEAMFRENGRAWTNHQFYRYALDRSCRGQLLLSGHCPQYRRKFLEKPGRYMPQLDRPYEACRGIRACK
ncbi:hypothetical protein ASPCADRAFT_133634 [Aspergillus carbonarius ITEM 5010]|uniref:Saposin B-type domain-containing protein n=1 Tax=Aspergillus carbonarius (strain ITEM 5010) TaxID=602072 RepID=A0A1R3RC73_ASPC5|nr:hypothetical protein ASPCADRAFT_133634 [Aspergillus carbonarius ITEM 5010]